MSVSRASSFWQSHPRVVLYFAWLAAGLLFAQQAAAWPDLRITKNGPAQAAPGEVITYTLNYTNAGPVKSTGVVMKDFLPTNVAALTNTLNGGTLSGSTLSWSLGSVSSRASGSRSFQVRISTNAPSGFFITNRCQIFGSEAEENGKTNDNFYTFITRIVSTNQSPVAVDDNYSTSEDVTLVISPPGILANDSDANGDSLTVVLVAGPSHGVLALNASGGFTYSPQTNYSGVDSYTYRASDGKTNSGIATVTITVTPVNDPPIARNDQYSTIEDTALDISAPGVLSNDSDPDGDALTAIIVTSPGNGQVSLNSNGSFRYTPNANFNGTDSFTYRANDGKANSGVATVTLTVTPVNDPPAAVNDAYTINENSTLAVSAPGVLGNDSDPDGNALAALLVTGPTHGVLSLDPNGGFTYQPNSNYFGLDSYSYRATDGSADSGIATVAITVLPVNGPPVARDDQYSTPEDTSLVVAAPGVLANDSDADNDALTVALISTPTNGVVVLNPAGGFTYTPQPNFIGVDVFTYGASDGITNSQPATVTITVLKVNHPPVAQNDQYSTPEDTTLLIGAPGVLKNDSDADGDPLTSVLLTNPSHGSLALNSYGGFVYTPDTNFNGVDAFTYRANDGATNSEVATVTITVTSVNDAPVAQNDEYSSLEDTVLAIPGPGVLANDSDADGDLLTASLITSPTNGVLVLDQNGGFTYTPGTNFNGLDTFTYRANDGHTDSGIAAVTITVTPTNDAPIARDDDFATPENSSLTIGVPGVLANDYDADGDALSAHVVTPTTNGLLILTSDGSFVYTPNTNYAGLDSFTYRANDGIADSAPATVLIDVIGLPPPPPPPPDTNNWNGKSFTLYEDTILNVSPPGVLAGIVDSSGRVLKAAILRRITNGTINLLLDGSFNLAPLTNFFGQDSFDFAVTDGQTNLRILTVDITVIPVNDPPSFAKGGNLRLPQNAGPQVVTNWATGISPGPVNESDQLVTFQVSNDNSALFTTQPAVDSGGTLTFTPLAGASGTASVTVVAHDNGGTADGGVDTSAPQTFTITLNTPPTVQIVSPTNGAVFFAPGAFTVLADAQDVDGVVTNVAFFSGTNRIADATTEPFFTVLTNLPVGSYTLGAQAMDDFGATGSAVPITVNVLERPPLTYLTSVYYNPQKDFFEQRVRVTNPTYSLLDAVRVLIFNLTNNPAITVGNRSGVLNGIPYVQSTRAIPPGSYVDFTIEYLSPMRIAPNPVLQTDLVSPATPLPLALGTPQHINRGLMLANRTFLVEFNALSNRVYSVEYSDDLLTWKAAQPAVVGEGTWIQWIDNGEPKTDGSPAAVPARFYRLRLLP